MSLRDYYADEELFVARTCGRDDGTGPCDEVLVGDDKCPCHDEEEAMEDRLDREPWLSAQAQHLPDERGGMQCLAHVLSGWPTGEDCPCVKEVAE